MQRMNPDNSTPLYVQLMQNLREQIHTGKLQPGEKLPSERALCEIYDVSRITVRHAISEAEKEGLVKRAQGMGTFVSAPKYQQSLSEVKSFAATMLESGLTASTEVLAAEQVFSDFGLAGVLQLPVGSTVQFLRLRGTGNDTPRVVYDSYIAEPLGSEVASEAKQRSSDDKAFSTLDVYRESDAGPVTRLEQTFEAVAADAEIAKLLQVDEGWPIFQVETVMFRELSPIEYRLARYRGDHYKFALERSLDT